jgi:biopolymer transport protein ExbB
VDLVSVISKAGFIGYLLLLLSVISVAIIIEKLLVLRMKKLVPREDLRLLADFFSRGSLADAVELCKKRKSLLSKVVYDALRSLGAHSSVDSFISSFEVFAKRRIMELERGMAFLASVAAISPLLGLLGTVLGMIKIFGVLTAGGSAIGNPQQLSAGIAEALLTTVMGLFVAIPALFAYNLINRRLDKVAAELEQAGILLYNALKERKQP